MLLKNSMFDYVLFPVLDAEVQKDHPKPPPKLVLRRHFRYRPPNDVRLEMAHIVVFDFETTGLDSRVDGIIEIGAQKYKNGVLLDEMSTFIAPPFPVPESATKVSGITNEMLIGAPELSQVLRQLMKFMDGCFLVAHNASFDVGFLLQAFSRQGIDWDWAVFCTLKMARELLPQLERKNLDTLAKHYGLTFESRHRSIGDVKVTADVLWHLLSDFPQLKTWGDVGSFKVSTLSKSSEKG